MFYRFKQKWCIAFPPDEGTAELIDKYYTTSAEADTRIWQHATRILIYSPDTDVYNIGLGFTNQYPTATFIIQLNFPHSDENKYINLTSLYGVLLQDMDQYTTGCSMCDTSVTIYLQWV